jgi:hypothetical protein
MASGCATHLGSYPDVVVGAFAEVYPDQEDLPSTAGDRPEAAPRPGPRDARHRLAEATGSRTPSAKAPTRMSMAS